VKRALLGVTAIVLLAGAGTAAALGVGGDPAVNTAVDTAPHTTPITRGTLTQTEDVDGTLGYGDTTTITARGAGGTLTWLPAAGATIPRGGTVYRVDQVKIPLIFGTLPLYRTLAPGDHGADVAELERNLKALGYTGFTVDDHYTSATATVVKAWQKKLGASRTGVVSPGDVVVAPAAIRITTVHAALGDPAGGSVATYASTVRTVSVALDVSLQNLVHKGVAATITLPDNSTVDGTVATVGTVATAGSGGDGSNPTTVSVTISVADQHALGTLDGAPVDVTLTSAQAKDVLSVPVEALVALAEGGYGVQVVTGATSQYVAVTTGMFANGRVEITGDGITAGTVVGVPSE